MATATKKKTAKKKSVTKKRAATKKGADINKSQAIRDFAASHPDAGPTETAKTLTEKHGVPFSPSAVSVTLSNAAKKAGKATSKPRGRKAASSPASTNGMVSVDSIKTARQLIDACGGDVENAIAVVKALAKA